MKEQDKKTGSGLSLRLQYTLIFAGLMSGIIFLTIFLCLIFLPGYYRYSRLGDIRKAYDMLLSSPDDEELYDRLDEMSLRNNVSTIILSEDSSVKYSSVKSERDIDYILLSIIFGSTTGLQDIEIVEENENYSIRISKTPESEYMEMFGRLSNGCSFLFRTPLESIDEASTYVARFFLIIGIISIIPGAIVIYLVSRKISRPILNLSDISKRMVNLDFDARYEGHDAAEISLLGENINTLSESLEQSISELKTANNELKRDIEKKEIAAKEHSEFISNVSHELKTPLALIQGYAEGLKEGISDDPESREYYLDVIMDETSRMNKMVKQLISLDQFESGDDVIDMQRFDIAQITASCLKTSSVLTAGEGITVYCDEDSGVFVWGDPFLTETVFENYLTNAIHFCKDTGAGKYIKISFIKYDKIIRVCVFNSGDHIEEDQLPRLWDKFYKADKARTRAYGGSGVGLSIVKAIQTSIGQKYGAENVSGGVEFWFELEGVTK